MTKVKMKMMIYFKNYQLWSLVGFNLQIWDENGDKFWLYNYLLVNAAKAMKSNRKQQKANELKKREEMSGTPGSCMGNGKWAKKERSSRASRGSSSASCVISN